PIAHDRFGEAGRPFHRDELSGRQSPRGRHEHVNDRRMAQLQTVGLKRVGPGDDRVRAREGDRRPQLLPARGLTVGQHDHAGQQAPPRTTGAAPPGDHAVADSGAAQCGHRSDPVRRYLWRNTHSTSVFLSHVLIVTVRNAQWAPFVNLWITPPSMSDLSASRGWVWMISP